MMTHFESRLQEQQQRHQTEVATFKQQLGTLGEVERNVQSTQLSVLESSLRAANPDWDNIRTSPEWQQLLGQTDAMTGTTNKQLLDWRMRQDGTAGAVDAYNTLISRARLSNPRGPAQTQTLASLATPQSSAATAPLGMAPSRDQELSATAAALDKIRSKVNKSENDLTIMNQLYGRLKALSNSSPVVGVSASL
jgi:hypothetical protein